MTQHKSYMFNVSILPVYRRDVGVSSRTLRALLAGRTSSTDFSPLALLRPPPLPRLANEPPVFALCRCLPGLAREVARMLLRDGGAGWTLARDMRRAAASVTDTGDALPRNCLAADAPRQGSSPLASRSTSASC